MGMERRIALLILVLLVVVGARSLLMKDAVPVFQTEGGPAAAVYFASSTHVMLEPEFYWGDPSLQDLAHILVKGPKSRELLAVLPPETSILAVYQRDNVVYVDFSRHLVVNHPGGSSGELVTVYGIVNTFASLTGVEKVQILVEGRRLESLAGHLYIGEPLPPDYSLAGALLI